MAATRRRRCEIKQNQIVPMYLLKLVFRCVDGSCAGGTSSRHRTITIAYALLPAGPNKKKRRMQTGPGVQCPTAQQQSRSRPCSNISQDVNEIIWRLRGGHLYKHAYKRPRPNRRKFTYAFFSVYEYTRTNTVEHPADPYIESPRSEFRKRIFFRRDSAARPTLVRPFE